MLRAIPLPDETVWSLKFRRNPEHDFNNRMRLWVFDQQNPGLSDDIDKMINDIEIEKLVTTETWSKC